MAKHRFFEGNKMFIFLFLLAISLSCADDNETQNPRALPLKDYTDSYLIVNKGNDANKKGMLNTISSDYITFREDVFTTVNMFSVGNLFHSASIWDEQVFFVSMGSNEVNVVDKVSLKSIFRITEQLSNPTHAVVTNNKLYISNLGQGGFPDFDGSTNFLSVYDLNDFSFLRKIDLNSNQIFDTYALGNIYTLGNHIYILNTGFGLGDTITIVNSANDEVETHIRLSQSPTSAVAIGVDLYILCGGRENSTSIINEAEIWKINARTATNVFDFDDFDGGQTADFLSKKNNILYFILNQNESKSIYKLPVAGSFSDLENVFDLMEINKLSFFTVTNNRLILLDDEDVNSGKGFVYFYTINGQFETSFSLGNSPVMVVYNE